MNALIKQFSTLFLLLFFAGTVHASQLDIHHIGVGQGDATLFVFTYNDDSTVNILIDTGNSSSKGTEIFNYLVAAIPITGNRKIDILITSHLHSDHYGGTPKLLELLGTNNWPIFKIIDRNGGVPPDPNVACYTTDGVVVDNDPVPPEYGAPGSALYKRYIAACDKYFPGTRENYMVGTELFSQVLGKKDYTFKFWSLANNACILSEYGTKKSECFTPNNENDLSNAWLIQYDGFKYFTGGDIGGGGGSYLDLETPLCDAFLTWPDFGSFHFCSFKVSHHGSAHSTNSEFVSTGCGNPTLAVVPSALRSFSGTQIPTKETLERIAGHPTKLLYTFIKNDGVYYNGLVNQYNHVLLTMSNPGFGQNIPMQVKQVKVNKSTLEVVESWGDVTVTCSKNHDAPSAQYTHSNLDGYLTSNSQSHSSLQGHVSSGSHNHVEEEAITTMEAASKSKSKLDRKLERLEQKKMKQKQRLLRRERKMLKRLKRQSAKLYMRESS